MRKFIDLKCDFGFKYCMQDEEIMKSFLNAILEEETDRITSVKFENVESTQETIGQRGVTFDLLCTTKQGETVLIEMQNSSQKYFKTRAAFYISRLMERQIKRGLKWEKMEHDISRIFGIFIMGENNAFLTKPVTRTSVYDRDELIEFWDRNHNFFISLPQFRLDMNNFTTKDIWLYLFKNLGKMENIDSSVYERADKRLLKLIEKAKVAALSEEEYNLYEASMKALEDEMDMEEHGYKRGREKGREEGILFQSIQMAKEMIRRGYSIEEIAQITQLSAEEIKGIKLQ